MNPAQADSESSQNITAPDADADLRAIYAALDSEVAQAGPVCELSGKCCRFQEYGHTLFLSKPEFDYLAQHAPPPVRPIDSGETCPWQDHHGRCQAREARPLGCRVYFCDPAYADTAPILSERFITLLKRHSQQHNLEWNYAPLHDHLRRHGLSNVSPTDPVRSPRRYAE